MTRGEEKGFRGTRTVTPESNSSSRGQTPADDNCDGASALSCLVINKGKVLSPPPGENKHLSSWGWGGTLPLLGNPGRFYMWLGPRKAL